MSALLVVYQSRFGHSADVADHIADRARERNVRATVLHVDVARTADLGLYDAVVVVAPVYFGGHPAAIRELLRTRRADLRLRPVALVSIENAVARAEPAAMANAARKLQRLAAEVGLKPDVATTVAGAIAYPRYGAFLRLAMRLRAFVAGAPTDPSAVHVLTDWNALDRTLAPFLERLVRSARAEPNPEESGVHRIVVEHRPAHAGGGWS